MGVVYEAFDLIDQRPVALKLLRGSHPAGIAQFKHEFRALADINHPNLVPLYHLAHQDGQWMFSMAYVEGPPVLAYVQGVGARDHADSAFPLQRVASPLEETAAQHPSRKPDPVIAVARGPVPIHVGRLEQSLLHISEALHYLHEAGRLHRDVKPSNILVSASDHRVMICDFGLVTSMGATGGGSPGNRQVVGSLGYMAPEAILRDPLGPKSDWYSVGCLLFECLTGRLPFEKQLQTDPYIKTTAQAPDPRELVPHLPEHLATLCRHLLEPVPDERAGYDDVVQQLRGSPRSGGHGSRRAKNVFVGREQELKRLHEAFKASHDGFEMAYVTAGSGMGKTALVESFLESLDGHPAPLVLRGRCREVESVAFKGFDEIVDGLQEYLLSMSSRRARPLIPKNAGSLARLFPVMSAVTAIADGAQDEPPPKNPVEVRRQAFDTLRELLARISTHRSLVLFIDDLHWADVDCLTLLREVFRPEVAPKVMVIATHRDAHRQGQLQRLLRTDSVLGTRATMLSLAPLDDQETKMLVAELGAESVPIPAIREAAGVPLLLDELVRFITADDFKQESLPELKLEHVIAARVDRLGDDARHVLETLAVHGSAVSYYHLEKMLSMREPIQASVSTLQQQRLVRVNAGKSEQTLEVFHDKIRTSVISALAKPQLAQTHRRIAVSLESTGKGDSEAVVHHWLEAGERARASRSAAHAARKAAKQLAFMRATDLYRMALESEDLDRRGRIDLLREMADVMVASGRSVDAAEVYLEAANLCDATEGVEYMRTAAVELLRCGHVKRGYALLEQVMGEVKLTMPKTSLQAVLALLWHQLKLFLRGRKFVEQPHRKIAASTILQVDAAEAACLGLGYIETLQAAAMQPKHMLLALAAGDPSRYVRALALEAAYLAPQGPRGQRAAFRALDTAASIHHADPIAMTIVQGTIAHCKYQAGQFADALTTCERTEGFLRNVPWTGVWMLLTVQLNLVWSLFYLGRYKELQTTLLRVRREASGRGDIYANIALFTTFSSLDTLLQDDPETCATGVAEVMARWPSGAFQIVHYWELVARWHIDIYTEAPADALARLNAIEKPFRAALLHHIAILNFEICSMRIRTCVLLYDQTGDPRLLRDLERAQRKLHKHTSEWMQPLIMLADAAVLSCHSRSEAVELLERAENVLQERSYEGHVWCARLQRALLSRDPELVRRCEQALEERGVVNPRAWANTLATVAFKRHTKGS